MHSVIKGVAGPGTIVVKVVARITENYIAHVGLSSPLPQHWADTNVGRKHGDRTTICSSNRQIIS